MTYFTKKHFYLLLLLLLILVPTIALAADTSIPLEVAIGKDTTTMGLSDYISKLYNFVIGTIGVVAVVMMMYGGIKWAAASGNSELVGTAKQNIVSAIVGLVIALTAYTLLNTINPALISTAPIVPPNPNPAPATTPANSTAVIGQNCTHKSQACFLTKYPELSTKEGTKARMVYIPFDDGLGHSAQMEVFDEAQNNFAFAFAEIKEQNEIYANSDPSLTYAIRFPETYVYSYRASVGDSDCLSTHAFGIAIDVNPSTNPYCAKSDACYEEPPDTNMCKTLAGCDLPDW